MVILINVMKTVVFRLRCPEYRGVKASSP